MIATIEMPKGTSLKLELDKLEGKLVVDRILSVRCPANYGFIHGIMSQDGDNLDVFVLGMERRPLEEVSITPMYRIKCIDKGLEDDKIVAHTHWGQAGTPDVTEAVGAIIHYLLTYKTGLQIVGVELYEEAA